MRLDVYIYKRRNDEEIDVCYWRKNWLLMSVLPFEYDCGQEHFLTKDDVEKILAYVSHNPNPFGDFSGVEQVCELLYNYDRDIADGWEIIFHADW